MEASILVVDDESQITEMISKRLKRMGYEKVDIASNGLEAYNCCVEKLRTGRPYDVIISDWNMPKLTGRDFLEKIRGNYILKNTPFLMVTAFDEVDHVKDAIALKVNEYLVKPFQPEEFDRKVGSLLQKSKSK